MTGQTHRWCAVYVYSTSAKAVVRSLGWVQGWVKSKWTGVYSRGGALRYRMATHCQTAARSGSGERQNIGAVNSLEGKKGGRSTSNYEPNRGSNL